VELQRGAARPREGREGAIATDETTHVYEYPSGTGTALFYIRGDFVYSISGDAAYCICGDYWIDSTRVRAHVSAADGKGGTHR